MRLPRVFYTETATIRDAMLAIEQAFVDGVVGPTPAHSLLASNVDPLSAPESEGMIRYMRSGAGRELPNCIASLDHASKDPGCQVGP